MPTNAFSHYPGGFPHGLTVRGVPILSTHAGNIWWVDSGHANASDSGGADGTINKPFATIDYAVGRCTASNGDMIIVAPGHTETVSAAGGLTLDVAGVTILFLGDGTARGRVNFTTAVGADMEVDAANVTLINPRFTAGIDALTGPIDVDAANFRMFSATWEDGTTINTTDCVVADANADDLVIDGFTFIDGDAAGTQKQSFIQVAGATRPTIRNIRCTGDFGTGIIENGTAWVDATLEDLVLDNASASPTVCLLLQATSSGWVRNSSLRVASGSTGYTANNDMQFDNVNTTGTDAATAADPTIGNLADSAATGAVTTTDTLVAYIKQLVTMMGPAAADTDPVGVALTGTGGITTIPAAAVPANGVNVFELLREIWAVLNGTAANENGIQTMPAAAAPANNVSLAEVLRAIYNAVAADSAASSTVVQPGLGRRVTKVGDIASAPDDLFTVTGKCLITCMVGEVTSVLATTQSLAIVTSTNNQTIAAASQVTSDAAGTIYIVSGDPDLALNGGGTPGEDAATLTNGSLAPFMVNDDRIYQSINGAGTGTIQWDLWYIPLEDSASVASSA